jgi:hypothetical protein
MKSALAREVLRPIAALAFLVVPLSACPPKMIPHTEIPDTPDNRAIIDVMHKYREAFQDKDAKPLVQLASPRYLDARDSIGYEMLEKQLQNYFDHVNAIHMDITPRRIVVEGDHAHVDYIFALNYLTKALNARWVSQTDDKRMTLEKENGVWRVTSGY